MGTLRCTFGPRQGSYNESSGRTKSCELALFQGTALHLGKPRRAMETLNSTLLSVYQGASVGPGWAPRRALWASKAARTRSVSRDCVPPRRAVQDNGNPSFQPLIGTPRRAFGPGWAQSCAPGVYKVARAGFISRDCAPPRGWKPTLSVSKT